jgi:hypothetical protein
MQSYKRPPPQLHTSVARTRSIVSRKGSGRSPSAGSVSPSVGSNPVVVHAQIEGAAAGDTSASASSAPEAAGRICVAGECRRAAELKPVWSSYAPTPAPAHAAAALLMSACRFRETEESCRHSKHEPSPELPVRGRRPTASKESPSPRRNCRGQASAEQIHTGLTTAVKGRREQGRSVVDPGGREQARWWCWRGKEREGAGSCAPWRRPTGLELEEPTKWRVEEVAVEMKSRERIPGMG